MCKRCFVEGCEVLIATRRDICDRHFHLLTLAQQKRLDELVGAAPGTPNRVRYEAERDAAAKVLEAIPKRGLMGRASAAPAGPGAT